MDGGEGNTSPPSFEPLRTSSSPPVDDTLEPDSEDELFINEGPSLDDDDSLGNGEEGFSNNFDENSTFLDDESTTYGSPGLREAFGEGFGGATEQENSLDLEPSRTGSADNSRKNKRKNFRPRNIIYSNNESDDGDGKVRERDNSPMDLSVASSRPNLDSDSESETGSAGTKPKTGGLSVVRPEILFGRKSPTSAQGPVDPSPLSLLSHLSSMSGALNPFMKEASSANTMKDAFREVLKLYGMSSELVDSITQQSEQKQGKEAILVYINQTKKVAFVQFFVFNL